MVRSGGLVSITGASHAGFSAFAGRFPLRLLANPDSIGCYALTRNLDVTGGVRYKLQRDRLDRFTDNRQDSQAVYVGTAFKF